MTELIISSPAAITNTAHTMKDLESRFFAYIDVQDITKQAYAVCLRCFIEWTQANCAAFPTRENILQYKEWLASPHMKRRGQGETITFTADTQARYMRAVKRFFAWAVQEHLCHENPAEGVRGAKVKIDNTKRDAFERADALALLDSIDRSTDKGKRDYAMILLSMTAGLRIIEMQRANIGNMETMAGEHVLYIQGKGHKEADDYKKIEPRTYDAIMEYLATRKRTNKDAPLFASVGNRSREQRLTEPAISAIVKDRMKQAGYDNHKLSAHSLRHTSITLGLESGMTIQEAQQHARHASPETTGIYSHNLKKAKQHSEQRISDFLFGIVQDSPTQAADIMRRMTADQQAKALDLLRAIAG